MKLLLLIINESYEIIEFHEFDLLHSFLGRFHFISFLRSIGYSNGTRYRRNLICRVINHGNLSKFSNGANHFSCFSYSSYFLYNVRRKDLLRLRLPSLTSLSFLCYIAMALYNRLNIKIQFSIFSYQLIFDI